MAKLKYRGTGGVVELLDISNVLNRLSSLEAKMTAVETKLTVKSDGLWRYLVLGSFVIGWRTDRFVVPQWNSWGNLWESSAKLSSVIYPGGYQGKFSQVALFCNAKNVGEVTSCGVEFEDSSTPDVLNKFRVCKTSGWKLVNLWLVAVESKSTHPTIFLTAGAAIIQPLI